MGILSTPRWGILACPNAVATATLNLPDPQPGWGYRIRKIWIAASTSVGTTNGSIQFNSIENTGTGTRTLGITLGVGLNEKFIDFGDDPQLCPFVWRASGTNHSVALVVVGGTWANNGYMLICYEPAREVHGGGLNPNF